MRVINLIHKKQFMLEGTKPDAWSDDPQEVAAAKELRKQREAEINNETTEQFSERVLRETGVKLEDIQEASSEESNPAAWTIKATHHGSPEGTTFVGYVGYPKKNENDEDFYEPEQLRKILLPEK